MEHCAYLLSHSLLLSFSLQIQLRIYQNFIPIKICMCFFKNWGKLLRTLISKFKRSMIWQLFLWSHYINHLKARQCCQLKNSPSPASYKKKPRSISKIKYRNEDITRAINTQKLRNHTGTKTVSNINFSLINQHQNSCKKHLLCTSSKRVSFRSI